MIQLTANQSGDKNGVHRLTRPNTVLSREVSQQGLEWRGHDETRSGPTTRVHSTHYHDPLPSPQALGRDQRSPDKLADLAAILKYCSFERLKM